MPLVSGDLCPIAIDVIEKFEEEEEKELEEVPEEEYDSPLHYIDHKEMGPDADKEEEREENEILESGDEIEEDEDHPIIEKGGPHAEEIEIEDDEEHYIPEKGEHHFEEEYVDAEHHIPQKGEHHESDVHHLAKGEWKADYHGHETIHDLPEEAQALHEPLKPKQPKADDPRLVIPQGKSTAAHDHLIVEKETVPSPEHGPRYGEAYEYDRKEALRGNKESAGLAPKQPIDERAV